MTHVTAPSLPVALSGRLAAWHAMCPRISSPKTRIQSRERIIRREEWSWQSVEQLHRECGHRHSRLEKQGLRAVQRQRSHRSRRAAAVPAATMAAAVSVCTSDAWSPEKCVGFRSANQAGEQNRPDSSYDSSYGSVRTLPIAPWLPRWMVEGRRGSRRWPPRLGMARPPRSQRR